MGVVMSSLYRMPVQQASDMAKCKRIKRRKNERRARNDDSSSERMVRWCEEEGEQ